MSVCTSACAPVQARHTENVPKVEPFAIPIRSNNKSGFRGVTTNGKAWQVKNSAGESLAPSMTNDADLPRLAVAWAQWQMSKDRDKYKILFDEEWLTLWMHDLADISSSSTSEDVIKHWGGAPAQVCMVVVVVLQQ